MAPKTMATSTATRVCCKIKVMLGPLIDPAISLLGHVQHKFG